MIWTQHDSGIWATDTENLDGDAIATLGYRPGLFNPIICPQCGQKVDHTKGVAVIDKDVDPLHPNVLFEPGSFEDGNYDGYQFTCENCKAVMVVYDV